MDSLIETLIFYLNDWQQAAIDNTRYSVILITISVFFAGLVVWLWNRKTTTSLKQQLAQQHQTRQHLTESNDKLLAEQKLQTEKATGLEQQITQLTEKITAAQEQHQSDQLQQEQQHHLALQSKQHELEQFQHTLNDKEQRIEQLQNTVSKQSENQAKLVELEKEYAQLSNEFNTIKQQLVQTETELKEKSTLLDYQQNTETDNNDYLAKIAELESALTAVQSQAVSDSQKQALADTQPLADLENTIQKHNQQLQQFNEKLSVLLPQSPAVMQKNSIVTTEKSSKASKSFLDKVKNVVATLDNVDVRDKKFDTETIEDPITEAEADISDQDIWEKHQQLIDQLIKQSKDLHSAVQAKPTPRPQPAVHKSGVKETISKVQKKSDQTPEKKATVKEKDASFQDKLMGFYHKIRSS